MPHASSTPDLKPSSTQLQVRPLSSLDELTNWSIFCATRGFGQRGPGDPLRFAHRFRCDPTSRLEWVLICTAPRNSCGIPMDLSAQQLHPLSPPSLPITLTETSKKESEDPLVILGSCRLFSRSLFVQGESRFTQAIGWGEVCSEPEMRGRGVAGAVLTKALEMSLTAGVGGGDETDKHSIALLHAAAGVQGLYQKFGFTAPLRAEYGLWEPPLISPFDVSRQLTHQQVFIRKADFEKDVSELQRLHQHTVTCLSLIGWTERSAAYWSEWIRLTSRDHMWVLEEEKETAATTPPRLLAYACAQWQRDDSLKLCDFGFSDTCTKQQASLLLLSALTKGWLETSSRPPSANTGHRGAQASSDSNSQMLPTAKDHATLLPVPPSLPSLVTPLAVLQWLDDKKEKKVAAVPELADTSWMVRSLNDEGREIIERMASGGSRFIAFALDGF